MLQSDGTSVCKFDLHGGSERTSVVVITGGSEGLGRALGSKFAAGGHNIILVARDSEKLNRAAEEIRKTTSHAVLTIAIDLTEPDAASRLKSILDQARLQVEILVNNAGIGNFGPREKMNESTLRMLLELNIRATTELTYTFLPEMIASGKGGILNVASMSAFIPMPYMSIYAASKSFVFSMSRSLDQEVRHTGTRVIVLAPGIVDTLFLAKAGMKRSLWLSLMPTMDADDVARVGYEGFVAGRGVIIPGAANMIVAAILKILPHAPLMRLLHLVFSYPSTMAAAISQPKRSPRAAVHDKENASEPFGDAA
ncbi:MAG: SDR family oxidoreductase [Hyphomicrobiaceae bacterium]|nr:SDR family oxidoreductase [Hyphomicrobiaceae bacterium]